MSGLSEPADHLHQMERLALLCPIAVVIADAQRRVRFCNPAFQLLFLYQAEEVVGANLEDLIGVGSDSETGQAVRRVSGGEHVRQTMRTHRSDGATVEVEFLAVPDVHGGNFNGYCAFFQDITERRRTEKALKTSEAKFARAFRA